MLLSENNTTNINQIVDLKNKLSNVTVPMTCEVNYSDGLKQLYTFVSINNNLSNSYGTSGTTSLDVQPFRGNLSNSYGTSNTVQFYAGLHVLVVSAGNWKITFDHNIYGSTILIIPSPAIGIITAYDKSVYDGISIINYKNDIIVNSIVIDKNNIPSEYAHLVNVKKGDEKMYVEYEYNVSRWTIKMPYNLPTREIRWERYYGPVVSL